MKKNNIIYKLNNLLFKLSIYSKIWFIFISRNIYITPFTAELFASTCIFHSFEAGIANAISSFKWMKTIIIYEK